MNRLFESTLAPAVLFQNIWNKVDLEELGTHVHASTSLREDVSFFLCCDRKTELRDLLTKASQALNRLQMEAYIIHVFYYYVESLFQAFGEWSAAPRKRARNTPYPTSSLFFLLTSISLRYPHDLNAWNRLLRRPRAIALLSSEPCAASENVKLCKLMVKRMRDFFARALALVPRSFAARHSRVFSTYCE